MIVNALLEICQHNSFKWLPERLDPKQGASESLHTINTISLLILIMKYYTCLIASQLHPTGHLRTFQIEADRGTTYTLSATFNEPLRRGIFPLQTYSEELRSFD